MALIDALKDVLDRLAPRGWAKLLSDVHGLDITVSKTKLAGELDRVLNSIDRMHDGFQEFCLAGVRGIEPGQPALSLLYHAFASADVRPLKQGKLSEQDFPTVEEIDVIENYIYGCKRRTLSSFKNPVIAVFAYQYRSRNLSPHRQHADLAFSRTGVARVGTEAARYGAAARSFDPRPADGGTGFAVLPARYAAFIAEYRSPTEVDAVLRAAPGIDEDVPFLFPVHKLFAGKECLWRDKDTPLSIGALGFHEFHVNEKLRRIHIPGEDNPGRVKPLPQFDIDKPPFVRNSENSNDLARLEKAGASVLVMPVPNKLARTAKQKVHGKEQVVRFKVPKAMMINDDDNNRFWSSLSLPSTDEGRAAPEYVNIRQEVSSGTKLKDLNRIKNKGTPAAERFDAKLAAGGYEAAHLIDGTCDGVISVEAPSTVSLQVLPAFSLVTAADYFPLVDQVEIEEWVEKQQGRGVGLARPGIQFQHPDSGPMPLSDGRFEGLPERNPTHLAPTHRMPNVELPDPVQKTERAFDPTERANETATAIVGAAAAAAAGDVGTPISSTRTTSWLPDSASDVFAPGWDVSQYTVDDQSIYVSYGLGSPFPEDSKLCAALNSFWPAVAPDSSRTYGFYPDSERILPTAIPLTDGELGYHAAHPRVVAGEVASVRGWDGDFGPFVLPQANGGRLVDASDPMRSDHARAALDGLVGFSGLDRVDSEELIRRMADLQFCRKLLAGKGIGASPWMVTFEKVDDWASWKSGVLPRAAAALKGRGYIYVIARVRPLEAKPFGDPPLRLRFPVELTFEIQLSASKAFFRIDGAAFNSVDR